MEENLQSTIFEGEITGIRFGLATPKEICTASISDCPISHSTQLTNPFLGLPLEFGKCESCGTSEPGKCEGHFGYIELPIPIYHPSHVSELKRMLSLLCLKCLKLKNTKFQVKKTVVAERLFLCCEEASQISIREVKTTDSACFLKLKLPSRTRQRVDCWNFLDRYGFRYGDYPTRTLLPCEVMEILKKIPEETRKKLARKGYFPQDGYVLQYLPVPPNCLSVPDVTDGVSIMSSDLSISMLKKVLKQVEIIKSSRSGSPNFESHEVEASELQLAVDQYLQVRGTVKASRDADARFGINKESTNSSTKAWLEKMRTLFIRKGSGFSSRSVITGDAYKPVNVIGIPHEIAQRITFEERVSIHNMKYLQELVDNKLCLTYSDGSSMYSLREGSKGHTFLRLGQVVHRRIMDGDIVFINRPPTTHKHSLQALSVYVHDDHTVKINPLICGPLSADFDGDCIHLFYPQSLAAKAEVLELFSVERQLLSSHSGNLNLQLTTDSLLSLKIMFKSYFLDKAAAQQLAVFVSSSLPQPALLKVCRFGPYWTAMQILQTALPAQFDCSGDKYLIYKGDMLKVDFSKEIVQLMVNEVMTSIFFEKGPAAVLKFLNSLQPLLMENLFSEGFSVGLEDFSISTAVRENIQNNFKVISPLLCNLRSTYNELVELQVENLIRHVKMPVADFILRSSALGNLIDSKSDSAVTKVVQQIGFLGLQISDRGKFYSKTLVDEMVSHFERKYPSEEVDYPSAQYGLIQSCFFHGLDPYEEMVHSISTREVIVRSSRGLSEPGTLFKNLMAILRDVVICYDGTVRNVCSNSIIQFEYGMNVGIKSQSIFPAGEPVGVLAATAMSNPAYKAVLDSTPSSNSSWELMKEILLCRVNFKNDIPDRRVILYLNDCGCGRKYCQEKAAVVVKNQLQKVSLKDVTEYFMIEYKGKQTTENCGNDAGLVGHIHLEKMKLEELNISMHVVLTKCEETINSFRKKKKVGHLFKRTTISVSKCCNIHHSHANESSDMPCLLFFWQDANDIHLERTSHIIANIICPVLLETVIKGDLRICSANIIWLSPDTTTWIRNPSRTQKGELALDIVLEKSVVKQSGDAWRIVLDSCLPVLHLIDTTRSIPYAIKQVQELLGISCAFDQAVQRLSTSVTMVAKGVLKEHLILLANSMTCAGNLVGFNTGGYKALSHALDIQVPFTEATLFTPRKCFERASEKRHVDTLSSIVASCSWGKRVEVGTGSQFDFLWDTKEACLNQEGGTDVYSFLNMVRSTASGEETVSACLGVEVDNLIPDDEIDDWNMSPEHNSSDKPVFEDSAEFQKENQPDELKRVSSSNIGSNTGGVWDAEANVVSNREKSWSGWGTNASQTQKVPLAPAQEKSDWSSGDGWDTTASWLSSGNRNIENNEANQDSWSGWGTKKAESHDVAITAQEESARTSDWDAGAAWGRKTRGETQNVLTTAQKKSDWPSGGGWDTTTALLSSGDGNIENNVANPDSLSGWRTKKAEVHDVVAIKAQEEPSRSSDWDAGAAWYRKAGDDASKNLGINWGTKQAEKQDDVYTKTINIAKSGSGKNDDQGSELSGWDNRMTQDQLISGWASSSAQEPSPKSSSWNATSSWGNTTDFDELGLCKTDNQHVMNQGRESSDWANKVTRNQSMSGWASSNTENRGTAEILAQPMQHAQSPVNNSSWGKPKSPEVTHGWGSPREPVKAASHGWGMPGAEVENASERNQQWGQQGGEFKRNRWANTGDWKSRRNRPPKSPGITNDESSMSGIYTTTRQRLDSFTSQEQDILSDVEPLMQSIRRIMHQTGYNDGDPLSADDQSFVLDNVFNYHPDKAVKMGAGIDHVTVSRHSNFQESRCFYIVSTDGSRQDFSYRKCLEKFIKGKYPELAEEFIGKYFARNRGNRPRNPVSEVTVDENRP